LSIVKNFAQDDNVFHLVFDESTMKKFTYEADESFPDKAYWDFRIALTEKKCLILRVINNERYFEEINRLETEAIKSSDPMLSEPDFVKNINNSETRLNIIIFNKDKNN
jgi:hypothetical protein